MCIAVSDDHRVISLPLRPTRDAGLGVTGDKFAPTIVTLVDPVAAALVVAVAVQTRPLYVTVVCAVSNPSLAVNATDLLPNTP